MTSNQIFQEFEKMAIEWGKKHQIAHVGDVVVSYLGGKRKKTLKISSVTVYIGRNAQKTCMRTFVIHYCGRRIDSKGNFTDSVGGGILLLEFEMENGYIYKFSEHSEANEVITQAGLSFGIEWEAEAKEQYPHAYGTYAKPYGEFRYEK